MAKGMTTDVYPRDNCTFLRKCKTQNDLLTPITASPYTRPPPHPGHFPSERGTVPLRTSAQIFRVPRSILLPMHTTFRNPHQLCMVGLYALIFFQLKCPSPSPGKFAARDARRVQQMPRGSRLSKFQRGALGRGRQRYGSGSSSGMRGR